MESYNILAGSYDALTWDVDYSRWADYTVKHFSKLDRPVKAVLDLACGTGSLTLELARRGYQMTGVDNSPEMLALAEEKCRDVGNAPQFFCQSMEKLRLPNRVDACVCCLDSVNYVLQPKRLREAFCRVFNCLEPGGLFLFDADTPEKLEAMDGQVFLDETDREYCVWRGEYSQKRRICTFWMDIFQFHDQEADLWSRGVECHREYAYTMDELEGYLREAGFVRISRHGELRMAKPREGEQRVFFAARKPIARKGR